MMSFNLAARKVQAGMFECFGISLIRPLAHRDQLRTEATRDRLFIRFAFGLSPPLLEMM
jgi:hypothetical protein